MGQNCTSELPDTVLSEYLGDNEFGENADIDEIRIRNDALGTRNCKITLDVGKGIKSKKPSKKLVEFNLKTEAEIANRKLKLEESMNTIKSYIASEKQNFDRHLVPCKGPQFQPTLFYAHPDKRDDLNENERKQLQNQPNFRTFFAQKVVEDIVGNLKKEHPFYLESSDVTSKPFCLKNTCTFERALVELLNTSDKETDNWRKDEWADPDPKNWKKATDRYMGKGRCRDSRSLVIELACILPEKVHSTVYISCKYCGTVIQTTLSSKTWESVMMDVQHNIALAKSDPNNDEKSACTPTIATPAHSVLAKDIYLVTSMMGSRALGKNPMKPSALFRVYMYVNCASNAFIPDFIHGRNKVFFEVLTKDS